MKQGRQASGGKKPCEREKRWEGSYPEVGSHREQVATLCWENAEGEKTAREEAGEKSLSRL
jgi:hypothetical protein